MSNAGNYYGPPVDLGDIDEVRDLGELDAPANYYGDAAATIPSAPGAHFGPAGAPPVDSGAYYNYNPPPDAPPRDLGEIDPPAAYTNRWNAPGFEHVPPKGAMLGRSAPPDGKSGQYVRAPKPELAPAGPANIPDGPSPKDNKEFAALMSTLGKGDKPAAPKPSGGGGPSGPSAYDKATKALRGTYDDEKAALQRGTNAEMDRAAEMAQGAHEIAQRKMEDQAVQQTEAETQARHFETYQQETQRQIDDVKSQTIQPNRAYSDSGSAALAVIGGVLGGIYQGLNKLEKNPFIEQMNKVMDRDIAAQEHDLATKKGAIGERKSLLADMRATYKDEALAKLQAKNLYYEGAKEDMLARAATYDSPAIQAKADQAVTALSREQAKLDINEAMRKAAAAQAGAAAAEHRRQIDFKNRLDLQDMHNKTITAEAGAAKDAREGGAGTAGDPIGMVPKDQRTEAMKERAEYTKAEKGSAHIEKLFADYDRTGFTSPRQLAVYRSGIAGAVKAGAGPGMSSDKDYENFIESNLPNETDTKDTLNVKRDTITSRMRSSVATPTLDTHAPGWSGPPKAPEFGLDGKPK